MACPDLSRGSENHPACSVASAGPLTVAADCHLPSQTQTMHPLKNLAIQGLILAWSFAAEPFPLLFENAAPFQRAVAIVEKETRPLDAKITGVTVPHHLLAADMIARPLLMASGGKYDRIILITPDHFRRSPKPAATTLRSFRTVWGEVPIDAAAVQVFLGNEHVAESNLFSHEHGVHAILPFLAKWYPDVPVLPIVLHVLSTPKDWESLAETLLPLVTPNTLLIQSTDFSHYLSQPVAAGKDQEMLMALCFGNPAAIPFLEQPEHLDSKAAQWLQMILQKRFHGNSTPIIVDNRNAIRYGGRPDEPRTTSYVTQLYSPDLIPAAALPGEAFFFGGDTHFGRHVAKVFADPERAAAIRKKILAVTGNRPLIVNLEGVILDGPPRGYPHPMRIGMDAALAIPELKKLGVTGVSLANNHALDYGTKARDRMMKILAENGIAALVEGTPSDFGAFRVGVASDLANLPAPAQKLLTVDSFATWKSPAPPKPLVAFFHAGNEYADAPSARERQLAGWAETHVLTPNHRNPIFT
ncbi:MAG: AmmeMemoRadiSam system protein B [Verrucomicrobia bacterium]|nr:MAG: AmmeMemoRadiSam system protein B [Verrucomicrobiota bacterium]